MIIDNLYIEKILSEHFNELGSNYKKFRIKSYTLYNYCIGQDKNLNNKINYAIASTFYGLDNFLPINKDQLLTLTQSFLIQEELFEHIDKTLKLLSNPDQPFQEAIQLKNNVNRIRKSINKELALH